jgi:hypothetical protein
MTSPLRPRARAPGQIANLPAGAAANVDVFLFSVSCPSAGDCAAVGDYFDSAGNDLTVLLSESSGAWAQGVEPLQATPTQTRS